MNEHNSYGGIIIYLTILVSTVAGILSLPFLTTSINVRSTGVIRPTSKIFYLKALVNGEIKASFVQENATVAKGQSLFQIENKVNEEKEANLILKIENLSASVADLQALLQTSSTPPRLKTSLQRQAFLSHQQRLNEISTHYTKVKADFDRNKTLHDQKVISDSEFENFQFELNKASNDLNTLNVNQLHEWENEKWSAEKELTDYKSQLAQLQREKEYLNIKAPVTGSLQNLVNVYPGSPVFSNQELGQISPDTSLIIEALVPPGDIAFLKTDMPARFMIDAFHYNQWGMASGKILDVSHDIKMVDNKPFFEVRCSIDKDFLQLKNGYKGILKKGMTLKAHFMVTDRTLWQLLYDKVDDWINPTL